MSDKIQTRSSASPAPRRRRTAARLPVADELGARFAAAGHELHLVGGSVRDALLGRLGDDLDFATERAPGRDARGSSTAGPRRSGRPGAEFGTIGAARHGLRLEITTFRAEAYDRVSRNPIVAVRHQPARRPAPARLHDQRDGGLGARARVHRPVRRSRRSAATACIRTPGDRPGESSPTIRCGCCAPPGSPRSCGFAVDAGRRRRDDRRWPPTWPGSPPSGSATSSPS